MDFMNGIVGFHEWYCLVNFMNGKAGFHEWYCYINQSI